MCKQKMPCAPNATKVGRTEQMELSETVNSERKNSSPYLFKLQVGGKI